MPVPPTDELEKQGHVDENLDNGQDSQLSENTQDVNTADSSAAEVTEKPSMLDAVKSALSAGEEQSSGSGDEKGAEAAAEAATDESQDKSKAAEGDDLGDVTQEELQSYPAKTRRRVKQLLERAKGAETEISTLKPVAERMARIESFVAENNLSKDNLNTLFDGAVKLKKGGLTDDDFRTGVEMMLAVNNDPARAYQLLTPLMQSLAALAGEVLSPDLAEEVKAGVISEERALEISRARATRVVTTHQKTQAEEQAEAEALAQKQSELANQGNAVATAITNWENTWQKRDPDHGHKHALWREKMDIYVARIEMGKEPIPDAKTIVAKAEQFQKEVTATLSKMRPARNPIRSTPTGVNTVTGAKAVPGSLKDAISGALARA
jgi:hypothetical protein